MNQSLEKKTHTPGLWEIEQSDFTTYVKSSASGDLVCRVLIDDQEGHPDTEGEANANLIAAAPELLSACKQALFIVDSKSTHTLSEFIAMIDRLKNVIKQATGEE